ncbi:MAG: hypothetical protein ABFQ65_03570 [Nanoarchaeota archaeon]
MEIIYHCFPKYHWVSEIKKARQRLDTTEGKINSIEDALTQANQCAISYLHKDNSFWKNMFRHKTSTLRCYHYALYTYGCFLDLTQTKPELQQNVFLVTGFTHTTKERENIRFDDVIGIHAFLEDMSLRDSFFFEPVPGNQEFFQKEGINYMPSTRIRFTSGGDLIIKKDERAIKFISDYTFQRRWKEFFG